MPLDDAWTCLAPLKILLIDSNAENNQLLGAALERSGMRVAHAASGGEGLALKASFQPDVILLDLNLEDAAGFSLVSQIAKRADCGLIIVSDLVDEADRVIGLELGADDYICKPPVVRELLARVRAVHRRVSLRSYATPAAMGRLTIRLGALTIDLKGHTVSARDGKSVRLTGAEFMALEVLVAADGAVVSRDCLCQAALHRPWRAEDRGVDQLILNLRQKLSDCGGQQIISTVRGAGYMLTAPNYSSVPLSCAA
jgi:two-component system OmpR family response regulator